MIRKEIYKKLKRLCVQTWGFEKYRPFHFGGDPAHNIPNRWALMVLLRTGRESHPYTENGEVVSFDKIENALEWLIKKAEEKKDIVIDTYRPKSRDQILKEILV